MNKTIKNKLKKFMKSQSVIDCISNILYYYARFVAKTSRWEIIGRDVAFEWLDEHKNAIFIGWHGRALMLPTFLNRRVPIDALVSLHQDGLLIAGLLKKFGVRIIGGSSNQNAKNAALSLMRSLQDDRSIAIVPDGPCGPNMRMTLSPIYYAQKTGKPIFTITYSTKRALFANKAWDKMMIPLPFSHGICQISGPFYVPETMSEEQTEAFRLKLEKELNQNTQNIDISLGHKPITPGNFKKNRRRCQ